MKALLIVDVQNDFIKGGTLAVENAEKVIPVINRLMDKFELIIATQDWHPEQSVHFDKWPVHCAAGTQGADLHSGLHRDKIDQIFLKGTGNKDDGYSAFEATNLDLAAYLKKKSVSELYICGVALEFCVKSSALDALKEGFQVFLISDAIATFSQEEEKVNQEYAELKKSGIKVILSNQI